MNIGCVKKKMNIKYMFGSRAILFSFRAILIRPVTETAVLRVVGFSFCQSKILDKSEWQNKQDYTILITY